MRRHTYKLFLSAWVLLAWSAAETGDMTITIRTDSRSLSFSVSRVLTLSTERYDYYYVGGESPGSPLVSDDESHTLVFLRRTIDSPLVSEVEGFVFVYPFWNVIGEVKSGALAISEEAVRAELEVAFADCGRYGSDLEDCSDRTNPEVGKMLIEGVSPKRDPMLAEFLDSKLLDLVPEFHEWAADLRKKKR